MRVLLISPPLHGLYHAASIIIPPLGLMYIAAVLDEAGHEVEIRDMTVDTRPIDYEYADVVGITCTTPQYNSAIQYAQEAHETGKTVFMGGCHVTFTAEETLRTGFVDYIVRGEGEMTALELVNGLQSEGGNFKPSGVLGLSWYDRDKDQVIDNPNRPYTQDINSLPYPTRDLLNMEPYKSTKLRDRSATTMITSRGCPYDCTFCSVIGMNGRLWRKRKAASVIDEIEFLVSEYGFEGILFVDDNIAVDVGRISEICDGIIDRGLDILWWCQSRADAIVENEEMVDKMAQSGCYTVFLGLESSNEQVLQAYNKKLSADVGEKAIDLLEEYGISAHASFIIGEVKETEEDIQRTIDYAKRINPRVAQFSILTPYPGTQLYEELQDRLITRDWSKYDSTKSVFRRDYLTSLGIEKMLKKAYRQFYMQPHRIANQLRGLSLKTVKSILKFLK